MDDIDKKIVELLKEDSKQNFKAIGEKIHMTGQAVGNRVRHLEDEGIIEGYTVKLNSNKQGLMTVYITLFMKSNQHNLLKNLIEERLEIVEASRISGEGCYILKTEMESHEQLNSLCDDILKFANYRINIVTDKIR